jgi:hypothetical protein
MFTKRGNSTTTRGCSSDDMNHLRSLFLERTDNNTVEKVCRDDSSDETDGSGDGRRHAKDVKVEDGDHERQQHDGRVPQGAIETPTLVPKPKSAPDVQGTKEGQGVEIQEHQSCKPSKLEHGHEDQQNVEEGHGHNGKQLGGVKHRWRRLAGLFHSSRAEAAWFIYIWGEGACASCSEESRKLFYLVRICRFRQHAGALKHPQPKSPGAHQ